MEFFHSLFHRELRAEKLFEVLIAESPSPLDGDESMLESSTAADSHAKLSSPRVLQLPD